MYINPPFNFTGSKTKLLPQILPEFDYSKENFVDLFMGGGSVYCNVVDKYQKVWANDIIKDLVESHINLIYHKDEFVKKVKSLSVSKEDLDGYLKLREDYNQNNSAAGLFTLMIHSHNNLMRFNQSFKFNQHFGKRTYNKKTEEKINDFSAHLDKYKDKLHFSNKQFYDVWPKDVKNTFIYLDPPYQNSEAGYNSYWVGDCENKLYDYITRVNSEGGTFALSGLRGVHKKEKESIVITKLLADGFKCIEILHDYSKVARDKDAERGQEILIKNY